MKGSIVWRGLVGQGVNRDVKLEDSPGRIQESGFENPDKSSGSAGWVEDGVGGADQANVFTDLELGDPRHLFGAPDLDNPASGKRALFYNYFNELEPGQIQSL